MKAIQEPLRTMACLRCMGFGKIADTKKGEHWLYWTNPLFPNRQNRINRGQVKPIECPDCKGTGKMDIEIKY